MKRLIKKFWVKFGLLSLIVAGGIGTFYIVGCQDLNFSSIRNFDCEANIGVEGLSCSDFNLSGDPGQNSDATATGVTSITTTLGRVNILFVIDNSGSMTEEHESLASQFDEFLDSIKRTDYQIAIITTDWVEGRGKFLEFADGYTILKNPKKKSGVHRDNVDLFQDALEDIPIGDTDDERGIYALNQALSYSNQGDFFRPHSLLMVIIVSDEDERSDGENLETEDLPKTFFRRVSSTQKFQTVAVHSIIIKPGDTDCAEDSGRIVGYEGRTYAEASKPSAATMSEFGNVREGHIGSICARNYSNQLGPIADTIVNVPPLPLPCFPKSSSVHIHVDGNEVSSSVDGRQVTIEDAIPFGTEVQVTFSCIPGQQA